MKKDTLELKPFFTGQYCKCSGEIWSDNFGCSCKKCGMNHIISPKTKLHIINRTKMTPSKIEEAKEIGINFWNNRFSFSFKRMDELNIEYGNQNQLEEGCLNEAFNGALNHLKESYEKEIKELKFEIKHCKLVIKISRRQE